MDERDLILVGFNVCGRNGCNDFTTILQPILNIKVFDLKGIARVNYNHDNLFKVIRGRF